MLKVDLKSDYKHFDFNQDLKVFDFKNDKILPCFNHYSIIRKNFLSSNYTFDKFTDVADVKHSKTLELLARNTLSDWNENIFYKRRSPVLKDFDKFNNLFDMFENWRDTYRLHPKLAQCTDDNGNTVFFQLLNRFDNPLRNIAPLSEALMNYKGKGVFLTLTYNHSISLPEAWIKSAKHWDNFMRRLVIEISRNPYKSKVHTSKNKVLNRRDLNLKPYRSYLNNMDFRLDYFNEKLRHVYPDFKRSDLNYFIIPEPQGNGYPHFHILFLGIDWLFYAGNKSEWENDGPHSKNLKHFWGHGSVFINKTKSGKDIKNPIFYAMKYIRKTWTSSNPDFRVELAHALLWAFNKRSWNNSRGLMAFLKAKPIYKSDLEMQGIVSFQRFTGQTSPMVWFEELNNKPVDCLNVVRGNTSSLDFKMFLKLHKVKFRWDFPVLPKPVNSTPYYNKIPDELMRSYSVVSCILWLFHSVG